MAKYVVDWNDRCATCGSTAAVVYEYERPRAGTSLRVCRHLRCSNTSCAGNGAA